MLIEVVIFPSYKPRGEGEEAEAEAEAEAKKNRDGVEERGRERGRSTGCRFLLVIHG